MFARTHVAMSAAGRKTMDTGKSLYVYDGVSDATATKYMHK